MSHPDQRASSDNPSEQSLSSLGETIDRANRAIEESRSEIARSRALGQSMADLNREIARGNEGVKGASNAQKDEA